MNKLDGLVGAVEAVDSNSLAGLRVALVGPLAPPAGGMANQTRQLAELLRADQSSVCMVQSNAAYRPEWAGRLPGIRAVFRLVPYLISLWRAASQVDVFHIMASSGWSWHLFAVPAIWIAHLRGVPVVVNYRGGEAARFLGRSRTVVNWSMQRVATLAVPSKFLQEVFDQFAMTAEIVPNVIDLSRFFPRGPRGLGDQGHADSISILVARNLEPLYDNATALRAFALVRERYPNAHLTIAGSGPEASRLESLSTQLGLQGSVRFAGRLDRDAMAGLYRAADVMLNPSLADNMPNSILEALACGVPVVSTNVGGVPFLVQDGVTALLVPPGDALSMADATLRLLDDDALWTRLSAAGVQEAQRYTWLRVAPILGGVYRRAIDASASSKKFS